MVGDPVKPIISETVLKSLVNLYGHNSKSEEVRLLDILARPPQTTVLRINTQSVSSTEALKRCKDFMNNNKGNHTYNIKIHPQLADVIVIAAQLFQSNPQYLEKEVMVDTVCGSAVLRGADIYVPGVLAAHSGMQCGDEVSVYVDVGKTCRKGLTKIFEGSKLFIGNGIAKYSRDEIFMNNGVNDSSGVAITMKNKIYNLPSFTGLDTNFFFPQNLPSILVGHILSVQENDVVLDMCAAPGGKTTHVATLLREKGTLVSIDKTPQKIARIQENLKNLKLSNVQCYAYDSTQLSAANDCMDNGNDVVKNNKKIETGPPFSACSFDKILLDPPCSGVGQRPQLRYTLNEKELCSYPKLQKKLFKQAVSLLKPGGSLVYSTCTLLPQENEEQVVWAIKTFPELELIDQHPRTGRTGLSGYGLTDEETRKVQRFDSAFVTSPGSITDHDIIDASNRDTIGFFIAKFSKKKVISE